MASPSPFPATTTFNEAMAVAGAFGSLLLRSDSDLPSVRRAMRRILESYGIQSAKVRVTPWSIQLATSRGQSLYAERIQNRSRHLGRIRQLGALSQAITSGQLRGVHLWESLQLVAVMTDLYPVWLRTLATSIAAAAILLLIGGRLGLCWPVVAIATVVQVVALLSHRFLTYRWLGHLMAGAVAVLAAHCLHKIDPSLDPSLTATGGLVPLVPGLLSEAIMADLLAADLLAAAGRMIETLCSAAPLAAGVLLIDWLVKSR